MVDTMPQPSFAQHLIILLALLVTAQSFLTPLPLPVNTRGTRSVAVQVLRGWSLFLFSSSTSPKHAPLDDDDEISQHEFMANPENRTASATTTKRGYQRAEDWHKEQELRNPKFVLENLQREKRRWAKKFEDLGGDGI